MSPSTLLPPLLLLLLPLLLLLGVGAGALAAPARLLRPHSPPNVPPASTHMASKPLHCWRPGAARHSWLRTTSGAVHERQPVALAHWAQPATLASCAAQAWATASIAWLVVRTLRMGAAVMHCCTTLPLVPHSADQFWQPSVLGLATQMLPRALNGWQ